MGKADDEAAWRECLWHGNRTESTPGECKKSKENPVFVVFPSLSGKVTHGEVAWCIFELADKHDKDGKLLVSSCSCPGKH